MNNFLRKLIFSLIVLCSVQNAHGQCSADFTVSSGTCFGDSTGFTFSGTAGLPTFSWNFGDVFSGLGNTSNLRNPKHKFSQPGLYTVTLVIVDTNLCTDTFTLQHRVVSVPRARFSVADPCRNSGSLFTSTSLIDNNDSILRYNWDFGDGNSDTLNPVSHNYAASGSKDIRLIINTRYCRDTIDSTITIHDKPIINSSSDSLCQNSNVTFSISSATTPSSYQWNYSDGFGSTTSSPVHQFDTFGWMKVRATLTYSNGTTCLSSFDSVFVHATPDIEFYLNSDTQCYNGNQLCVFIVDQPSNLTYRNVLFGDGFNDDLTSLSDTSICYSYTNSAGDAYTVTVQMLDINGCGASESYSSPVLIYPAFDVDFTVSQASGCFTTDIVIDNLSSLSPPAIARHRWTFGDGGSDTINWDNINHTYSSDGSFDIKLWAVNNNGCADSLLQTGAVTNTSFVVDAVQDSVVSHCLSTNLFRFRQTPIPGASIAWYMGNGDSSYLWDHNYIYGNTGVFNPNVRISKNGCDSLILLDSIIIRGPRAGIGAITNQYQCTIHDTVYFNNGSSIFGNQNIHYTWTFGDAFAPNCTTDVKNGLNVGSNCNYTKDSLSTRHWYTPGQEDCYIVKIVAYDSASGCFDSAFVDLPLMPPVAKPGLLLNYGRACLGPESDKTVTISLANTQPSCGRERYYIMWDSTCAAQSGAFNLNWVLNGTSHNYSYTNKPCDPDGFVTIGLIIVNGSDSNDVVCADTVFYHNILQIPNVDPRFTSDYQPSSHYCTGSTFNFNLLDTLLDSITYETWNWGDGTSDTGVNLGTRTHTYTRNGEFIVTHYLSNVNGCYGTDTMLIRIGFDVGFNSSDIVTCINEPLQFFQQNRYWGSAVDYWADPARIAAGKEKVKWDFGDGGGFTDSTERPFHTYSQAGIYTVRISSEDSLGCKDTARDFIRVHAAFAKFSIPKDTFVCAQVVSFSNKSHSFDSTSPYTQPTDSISSYSWTFAPQTGSSTLKNPSRFFNAGTYTATLIVQNTQLCADTLSRTFHILGPTAHFEFVSDSTGCQPVQVTFKNNSLLANSYTWQFADSANNVYTTSSDSNVFFTYTGHGKFYPRLTAQGNFINNGIPVTCQTTYPDTVKAGFREVTVYETPAPDFNYSSNCSNNLTTFINLTAPDTATIDHYEWDFGDGDTSMQAEPIHQYADTGHYEVILRAVTTDGCSDTIRKTVVISPKPIAHFTFAEVCNGATMQFEDSTIAYNDVIYQWRWDFGDGDTTQVQDPTKLYSNDSDYTVRLIVTNMGGCSDTAVRNVRVHSVPVASFSVTNSCLGSAVRFISSSTTAESPLLLTWDFGDGSSSSQDSINKTYSSPGLYTIKLLVRTVFGCRDSMILGSSVYPIPTAGFSINDTTQCLSGNNFSFSNSSSISSGSFSSLWRFGDGDSSTSSNPARSYADTGTFNVRLINTSDQSCRDTISLSVRVLPSPLAFISSSSLLQCLNLNSFRLADSSSLASGTYTRYWNTGDLHSSSDSILNHQYLDSGNYTVQLIINSDQSCADTAALNLRVDPSPRAHFSVNDSSQCLNGNSFVFSDSSANPGASSLNYTWFFADGDTSSSLNPVHSYTNDSSYRVTLVVRSDLGCEDTAWHNVHVYAMPQAAFAVNDSDQCLSSNSFVFSNQSTVSGTGTAYTWSFGDGSQSNDTSATHSYSASGNYTVKLLVNTSEGCSDSIERIVIVSPMPRAGWLINDSGQCLNSQNFFFDDTSSISTGTLAYFWDFGDSSSSVSDTVTHFFASQGTYNVKLRVSSDKGCSDSLSKQIIVFPKPAIAFSINDSTQCFSGHRFTTDNLSAGASTWKWYSGAGDSSTSSGPSFTYSNWGNYTVRLIGTSSNGCVDSNRVNIEVYPMPVPGIYVDTMQNCHRGNYFTFSDTSTIANGSYTLLWDLGDGMTSPFGVESHIYDSAGIYNVALMLTSDKLCRDTGYLTIYVYPQPQAAFTVNDSSQCESGNAFVFQDATWIASGTLTQQWQFGDLDTAIGSNPTHSYDTFGNYNVYLLVTSAFGCQDSVRRNMRVDPMPLPDFSVNDSGQCVNNQLYVFNDLSTIAEGTISRQWRFGDGSGSTLQQAQKTYTSASTYTVKLIQTSDKGCKDSLSRTITVYPKPLPSFSINDTDQCINNNIFSFTNTSNISSGSMAFDWNFGDGGTSTNASETHQYLNPGTFQVRLIAISDQLCVDTIRKNVIVYPKPSTSFTINDSTQCVNNNAFQFTAQASITAGTLTRYWWDLGNGLNQGDLDTQRIYTTPGLYNIRFVAQSNRFCYDTSYHTLEVYPKPTASFSINDSDQCVNNQQFIFTNNSTISNGNLHYLWDFGNTGTDTAHNPVKTFTPHDTLLVTLYAISGFDCYDTAWKSIIIYPKPMMSFQINDSTQCVNGNQFVFDNSSYIDYGTLTYNWDLGNGFTSTSEDTAMRYAAQATYPVKLVGTSDKQCRDSIVKFVIAYPNPQALFTVNRRSQCINDQLFVFGNQSSIDYGTMTYNWSFGDFTYDTAANVSHQYPKVADYKVELLAVSDMGCRDSATSNMRIFPKPDVGFTVNDSDQCVNNQNYQFSNKTTIAKGSIASHNWVYGNGTQNFVLNGSSFYPNSGFFRVSLIEESDSGCVDSSFRIIRVYPKPEASIWYNDSAQCLRENLYVISSNSFDSFAINQTRWNIAGLFTSTADTVRHSFADTGYKSIRLIVRNIHSCVDTVTRDLYVKPMPDPSFNILSSYYCQRDTAYSLVPITPGGVFSGNNVIGDTYVPLILWEDTVKYAVTVNACFDSMMQPTNVYPKPEIELPTDTMLCRREYMMLLTPFWNSTYQWSSGTTDSSFRINEPGTYWVIVSNVCGSDTDTISVQFTPHNCHFFVPNAFTPNGDDVNDFFQPTLVNVEWMTMSIYDRWGERVYKGTHKDLGWNGIYMGSPAAQGVFHYKIDYAYKLHGGEIIKETVTGVVHLIR